MAAASAHVPYRCARRPARARRGALTHTVGGFPAQAAVEGRAAVDELEALRARTLVSGVEDVGGDGGESAVAGEGGRVRCAAGDGGVACTRAVGVLRALMSVLADARVAGASMATVRAAVDVLTLLRRPDGGPLFALRFD